jgi:hypothetical protein
LNWGHKDFQSSALPTELSGRGKTGIKCAPGSFVNKDFSPSPSRLNPTVSRKNGNRFLNLIDAQGPLRNRYSL